MSSPFLQKNNFFSKDFFELFCEKCVKMKWGKEISCKFKKDVL
jgi:hypothetical protein